MFHFEQSELMVIEPQTMYIAFGVWATLKFVIKSRSGGEMHDAPIRSP